MKFATTLPLLADSAALNPVILVLFGIFATILVINIVCALVNLALSFVTRRALRTETKQ